MLQLLPLTTQPLLVVQWSTCWFPSSLLSLYLCLYRHHSAVVIVYVLLDFVVVLVVVDVIVLVIVDVVVVIVVDILVVIDILVVFVITLLSLYLFFAIFVIIVVFVVGSTVIVVSLAL